MGKIQFGTAIRDITPSEPVMLHGYSARTTPSVGVAEPLRLGALALSDGSTTIMVVTLDMVGVHTTEVEEIASIVEKSTGIPAQNVLVAASHTHFAPQISTGVFTTPAIGIFEPEASVRSRVLSAASSAARDAFTSLREGEIESMRVAVPSVPFNRRTIRPDGMVQTNYRYPTESEYTFSPVDPELTAIRISSDAGTGAVIVNYGCHAVTGGYDQQKDHNRISSDYIYYFRRTIEEAWGYPVFFTLGAAGDVVPRQRYGESRRRIGTLLGESVVLAERVFRPVEGSLVTGNFTLQAETIIRADPAEATSRYEDEREKSLSEGQETEGYQEALLKRFRSELYPENRFDIPVKLFRIGELSLAALPFEVLSEFALKLKKQIPGSILLSCAGGYQGYLPFEYEYARGGYEATDQSTHFVPGTADALFEKTVEELDSL